MGLIEDLKYNFTSPITRSEFSTLIIRMLVKAETPFDEIMGGNSWRSNFAEIFRDTNDPVDEAAYALEIVKGRGDGIFDPDGNITRQEAAIMLARAAQILDIEPSGSETIFTDFSKIAEWAKSAVNFVSTVEDAKNQAKIMNGTGNNQFSPEAYYSVQQAIITVKRLYNSH